MWRTMKLLVATNNLKKRVELETMLSGLSV
jgi:inosine/xanthosine triphosphate pyrophosphatase family protein